MEESNTLIGHIIDVSGSGLVATLIDDEQEKSPTVTIGDEDIFIGRIGSHVLIQQESS